MSARREKSRARRYKKHMPIPMAPIGKELTIIKVMAGDERTKRHLENIGVISGAKITVLDEQSGSVIVRVHDSRLALDKEMALKILVG